MKIAFVWSMGGPVSWNDENLEIGIGGSEAMIILRARALAKLGHEVVCFAPGNNPPRELCGVLWKSLPGWPYPTSSSYPFGDEGFDVLISLRRAGWGDSKRPAVRALWANDQACYDLVEATNCGECNLIITISEHQKWRYQRLYPEIPEEMYLPSSAGVEFDAYAPEPDKDPLMCVFSSTPERGLRHLIRLWRKIHKLVPEAKLRVTGGFELYGASPERAIYLSEGLYGTASYLPNARYMGPMPRSELIALQQRASLLTYPSIYDEMCCITALEMHVAGCAIVTTDRAALSERVRDEVDGYLIPGTPGTPAYDDFFVERTVKLLRNPKLCQEFGQAGREIARRHDHLVLAEQWVKRFEELT